MEKLPIRLQVEDFIENRLPKKGWGKDASFWHIVKKIPNFTNINPKIAILIDVIENKLIRQKLKRQIGYLENESSKIRRIDWDKNFVEGLEEDGSDDKEINVWYFDVVYPIHKYRYRFCVSLPPLPLETYIELLNGGIFHAKIEYDIFLVSKDKLD